MHCGQCTHWNQDLGEITGAGRCERFPPLQGWAQTRADDGCGEFNDGKQAILGQDQDTVLGEMRLLEQHYQAGQLIPVDDDGVPVWLYWAGAAAMFLAIALLAYNSIR